MREVGNFINTLRKYQILVYMYQKSIALKTECGLNLVNCFTKYKYYYVLTTAIKTFIEHILLDLDSYFVPLSNFINKQYLIANTQMSFIIR